METPEKVKASELVNGALAEFVVLQRRVAEIEETLHSLSIAVRATNADVRGLMDKLKQPPKKNLSASLGPERYQELWTRGYNSAIFGIPGSQLSFDDLMVLLGWFT